MADKLTDKQRLQLADALLGSDIGLDANCVDALQQGSRSERDFARLITRLYRLIHPASECLSEHARWEAENEREYQTALTQGVL